MACAFITLDVAKIVPARSRRLAGRPGSRRKSHRRPCCRPRRASKSSDFDRVSSLWFWLTLSFTVVSGSLGGLHKTSGDYSTYTNGDYSTYTNGDYSTYSLADSYTIHGLSVPFRKDAGSAMTLGIPFIATLADKTMHISQLLLWSGPAAMPDTLSDNTHTKMVAVYHPDWLTQALDLSPPAPNQAVPVMNSVCPWSVSTTARDMHETSTSTALVSHTPDSPSTGIRPLRVITGGHELLVVNSPFNLSLRASAWASYLRTVCHIDCSLLMLTQ